MPATCARSPRLEVALTLLLASCAGERPASARPAEGGELVAGRDAGVLLERAGEAVRLITGVPGPLGRLDPIGRCDGVRIVHMPPGMDRAPEEEEILFATAQILPGGSELAGSILLRTAERSDHEATVRVDVPRAGAFVSVLVTDLVGSRHELLECSVRHQFLPGEPTRTFGPQRSLTGDAAFRAPFATFQSEERALTLVPDLSLLSRERRIPAAIEAHRGPGPFLAAGLMSLKREGDGGVFTRAGAPPEDIREETLRFGHHVLLTTTAGANPPLAAVLRWTWERYSTPVLDGPPAPLEGKTLDELSLAILTELAADGWIDVQQRVSEAGHESRRGAERTRQGAEPPAVSFGAASSLSVTALAADLAGERWNRPELRRQAARVFELALLAPLTGGLFPTSVTWSKEGDPLWSLARDVPETSGLYHVFDCTWASSNLLRWARRVPARREEILERCRELGLFLLRNQAHDGTIPAWFTADLIPKRNLLGDDAAETSGAALFLAELAAFTKDAKDANDPNAGAFRAGAERAFAAVEARCLVRRSWVDAEAALRIRGFAQVAEPVGDSAISTLPLMRAAAAAFRLLELTGNLRYRASALQIIDELAAFQQVWSPPWAGRDLFGGLGETDLDLTWSSVRGGEAAALFLDAYEATRSREMLQRAGAAVRAVLAAARRVTLSSGESREQAQARAGSERAAAGAAAAAAILLKDRTGDAVVDLGGGFGEGIEPCRVADVQRTGERLSLTFESDLPASRPLLVAFRRVPDGLRRLRVICNGNDVGQFPRDELGFGVALRPVAPLRAEFAPPTETLAGSDLQFRAFVSPAGAEVTAEVDCTFESGARQVVPLARKDATLFAGTLPREALAGAAKLSCRLAVASARRKVLVPEEQDPPRVVELTGWVRADCGDDDERWLVDPGGSQLVRFPDGREWGRRLAADRHLVYALPVPKTTLEVDVEVAVAGELRILAGRKDAPDPGTRSDPGTRRLRLALKDRSLWESGTLELSFGSAVEGSPPTVGHVRISAAGAGTPAAELGTRVDSRAISAGTWYLLVLPLSSQEKPPLHSRESLDQHFFGGAEYVMTPPPVSVETSGSVARLVHLLSGGRVRVTGKVVPWKVLASGGALPEDAQHARRSRLLAGLSVHSAAIRTSLKTDLILLIDTRQDSETPEVVRLTAADLEELSLPGRFGNVPVCVVPDRDARGAIVPVGLAVRACLRALTPVLDVATRERGLHGELDLMSSSESDHVPPGLAALNLGALGWAGRVRLSAGNHRNVVLPSLQEGRQFLDLPHEDLPGRGSLLVSARSPGPMDRGNGALLMWDLQPEQTLRLASAAETAAVVRPEILRLIPGLSPVGAGDRTGAWTDLFAPPSGDIAALTEHSLPSSSTAHGEVLWQIPRLVLAPGGGGVVLDVDYRGVDLVQALALASWSSGTPGLPGGHPLVFGGPDREMGSAGQAYVDHKGSGSWQRRLVVRPRSGSGGFVRCVLPNEGPARLFGRVARAASPAGSAPCRLRAGVLEGERARVLFDLPEVPAGAPLEFIVDFPALPEAGRMFLEWTAEGEDPPAATFMDRLLLVPTVGYLSLMRNQPPPETTLVTEAVPLQDGRVHLPALRIDTPRESRSGGTTRRPVVTAYPVAIPSSGASLRLEVGLPASAPAGAQAQVTVTFQELTSTSSEVILPPVTVQRSEGTLPLFWLDLARVQGRTGRLILEVSLPASSPLYLVQAGLYPR